jgi:hypothetical protein
MILERESPSRGLLTLHFVMVRLATNTFPRPRTVRELSALGTSFFLYDILTVFLGYLGLLGSSQMQGFRMACYC